MVCACERCHRRLRCETRATLRRPAGKLRSAVGDDLDDGDAASRYAGTMSCSTKSAIAAADFSTDPVRKKQHSSCLEGDDLGASGTAALDGSAAGLVARKHNVRAKPPVVGRNELCQRAA